MKARRLDARMGSAVTIVEREMSEWQSIETAPMDGTQILTCRHNPIFECWDMGVVKWNGATWKVIPTRDFRLSLLGTHWMPLPEPPTD